MSMKRFAVGEPISGWPVETWNSLVDSKAQIDAMADLQRGTVSSAPLSSHAHTVLLVNKSGSDVNEYDVLGIDDAAMTPPASTTADEVILRGVTLEGIEPEAGTHDNAFAIMLQPVADDDAGHAVIAGVTWARVDITDTDHTCAKIKDATVANLTSTAGTGSPIIYKPTGTGVKWCVVRLPAAAEETGFLGIATTDITAADWSTNPPTLGYGTVQPYNLNQDDIPELVCPSGGDPATETWYNMSENVIDDDRVVQSKLWQGIKLIDVELCDDITLGCT